jgi:hypothetical protein
MHSITLNLPDPLYTRFIQAAQAMQQPLEAVLLRVMQVGSPPSWESVPAPFQAELAALDRLPDAALWEIARGFKQESDEEITRYDYLLSQNANGHLTPEERAELDRLRTAAERFMLRKAQAAAILRWRGNLIPPAEHLTPIP